MGSHTVSWRQLRVRPSTPPPGQGRGIHDRSAGKTSIERTSRAFRRPAGDANGSIWRSQTVPARPCPGGQRAPLVGATRRCAGRLPAGVGDQCCRKPLSAAATLSAAFASRREPGPSARSAIPTPRIPTKNCEGLLVGLSDFSGYNSMRSQTIDERNQSFTSRRCGRCGSTAAATLTHAERGAEMKQSANRV